MSKASPNCDVCGISIDESDYNKDAWKYAPNGYLGKGWGNVTFYKTFAPFECKSYEQWKANCFSACKKHKEGKESLKIFESKLSFNKWLKVCKNL